MFLHNVDETNYLEKHNGRPSDLAFLPISRFLITKIFLFFCTP